MVKKSKNEKQEIMRLTKAGCDELGKAAGLVQKEFWRAASISCNVWTNLKRGANCFIKYKLLFIVDTVRMLVP